MKQLEDMNYQHSSPPAPFMNSFIKSLDLFRARFLKVTLRYKIIEILFMRRSFRMSIFFIFSLTFNLFIALYFPLWSLFLGPLILGIPHIVSTLRYVPQTIKMKHISRQMYHIVFIVFISMALLRLFLPKAMSSFPMTYPHGPELLVGFICVLTISWKSNEFFIKKFLALIGYGSLCYFAIQKPAETIGTLILTHNFIAFIYWFFKARTKLDQLIALTALLAFSALSYLIWSGFFDTIVLSRSFDILDGNLNDFVIGSSVFPNHPDEVWSRAVSLYAFGQGIHYFIWLKAIPENELKSESPVSFGFSYRSLRRDFGQKIIYLIALSIIFFMAYGLYNGWTEARLAYIGGAAFHGYFELAGLFFLRRS